MSSLDPSTPKPLAGYTLALGAAAAVGVLLAGAWIAPRPANATSGYASQTHLSCGRCHVSAAGGGALTSFGKSFAANGHKLPGKSGAKGKSSSAAPGSSAVVTTEVAAPSGRGYIPDTTGSSRHSDYVPGTNPGVVFYGMSPGPVVYGGGFWNRN